MPKSSKIASPFARRGVLDQATKENRYLLFLITRNMYERY